MDSYATNAGAVAMYGANRVSTRSTRKSKSKVPTPRKLIESLTSRVPSKKLGDGVLEAHKEFVRESPTFFAYWKEENIPKNAKQDVVLLYDYNRVILTGDSDYYHASYVDGCFRPRQYIMAQAPFNEDTRADFFRMLAQVHPAAIVFMEAHNSEDAKYIFPSKGKYGGVNVKVEDDEKCDEYCVRQLKVDKSKIKVHCINGWEDENVPPKDFTGVHEKIRNAIDLDEKSLLMVVCQDGCTRCGLYVFLDMETDRLQKKGRMKLGETIRILRYQRSNCFDKQEMFEAATTVLADLAKKALEKSDISKDSRESKESKESRESKEGKENH